MINLGPDYQIAKCQAQCNANWTDSSKWSFKERGMWWQAHTHPLESTPPAEQVNPDVKRADEQFDTDATDMLAIRQHDQMHPEPEY